MRKKTRVRKPVKRQAGGKRKVIRRQHRRGAGWYDYVPSLQTTLSYIPGATTAQGYYNSAYDAYNTGKEAYNTGREIYDNLKPVLNTMKVMPALPNPTMIAPPLPPMPRGGLPERKSDLIHNARLNAEAKKEAARIPIDDSLLGKIQRFGKKYQPISKIDSALRRVGLRDSVRGYLSNNKLGLVNTLADSAIQAGYGKRRRRGYRRL